jgi:hypothetical protein
VKGRDLHGLAALILAAGVAVAIVALAIGAAATEAGVGTGSLSSESSTLLSTVLGAAVGAVAAYLGTTRLRNGDTAEPPPEPRWRPDDADA